MVAKTDIEKFVGKTISLLYDNETGEKANQNGKLLKVSNTIIELDPRSSKYNIEAILIPLDRVISIWIFGEEK